ncbi:MAG: hypothetical protein FD139_1217 [Methylocystaceae bacterium]|nr:MAG: hypothetical protein FD148_1465 [Methylocystaceae bacterium]KAF0210383.1 MAG: hypothetical protein FD172_2712 [Methylocystaceae bacterium]TXT45929.1 MAG: hypothetical protein FD139_1217 [Methylocystaceae bacterium]
MAGLVPAIHETQRNGLAWMAGSRPAMTAVVRRAFPSPCIRISFGFSLRS